MNLYQHEKNQLIPSVHSSDTVNFIVQRPGWPHPIFTMPNQKIFHQILLLHICIMQKLTLFHQFVLEEG